MRTRCHDPATGSLVHIDCDGSECSCSCHKRAPTSRDVKTFWAADVIEAFKHVRPFHQIEDEEVATFLKEIQTAYDNRWERDPKGGEGAVQWLIDLAMGGKAL